MAGLILRSARAATYQIGRRQFKLRARLLHSVGSARGRTLWLSEAARTEVRQAPEINQTSSHADQDDDRAQTGANLDPATRHSSSNWLALRNKRQLRIYRSRRFANGCGRNSTP